MKKNMLLVVVLLVAVQQVYGLFDNTRKKLTETYDKYGASVVAGAKAGKADYDTKQEAAKKAAADKAAAANAQQEEVVRAQNREDSLNKMSYEDREVAETKTANRAAKKKLDIFSGESDDNMFGAFGSDF